MSFCGNVYAHFDKHDFTSIALQVLSVARNNLCSKSKCPPPQHSFCLVLHCALLASVGVASSASGPALLGAPTLHQFVSFHFARNRFGRDFWLFHSSLMATSLELAPRRCLILSTLFGFDVRLWLYTSFINQVRVHETFVSNWMDGTDGCKRVGKEPLLWQPCITHHVPMRHAMSCILHHA